ncbi:MAG TPA: imidazolonepropionase [Thermoplasmata archaeon]|nr:imidazolonepropionase [Thermoplasmata archaeon]
MIAADGVFVGISELATLAVGPVPRRGPAMGELGIVPNAALAIRQGRIVWTGAERQLRRQVRLAGGRRPVDLGGRAVLPGFVDAHTHLLFAGDRHREITWKLEGLSYSEIARQGGGIYSTVTATRRASDAELVRSALDRLRRMHSWGTTTAEVKSGYALTLEGELRLLRLVPRLARASGVNLVPTFLGAHAVPPEYADRADVYIDQLVERWLPRVARAGLARFCDVFCEPGFFDVAQSEKLLFAAARLGFGLKVHADEFHALGGAALAARVEARSAEHLLTTPSSEYPQLASAGVVAVLAPVTPFAALSALRSPGRELVDAGVPVALGTDLSPNSWVEAMPLVLAHAVYDARLSPSEAITASTVNAAYAIAEEERAGQLAPGRPADFSVFPVEHAVEVPYRFGTLPARVYRRGKLVFSR